MRECHRENGDVEKLPRTASCPSASLQRGKDFPGSERQEREWRSARPKRRGKIKEKHTRMLPSANMKKQCSPPRHVEVVGDGAQVDPSTVLQGSHLARRNECRSGQRVADVLSLPHLACWALVLGGTKRRQDMQWEHV